VPVPSGVERPAEAENLMTRRPSRFAAFAALAAAVAGLLGCQKGKAPPPAPPPAKVTVARPVTYPVQSYYEYNGYLDAVETVQVKARVKGFLDEVTFAEGEEVRAGDLLYVIDPRETEANLKKADADRLKAKSEVTRSKADEDRSKKAFETGATSAEEFQQKVANRESAEAVLKQTEAAIQVATLDKEYTRIVSPIAGRISRTLVTKGNLVGQNEATLLTTIVSIDPLYVYFDIPERDLIEYQQAQRGGDAAAAARDIPVEIGVASEEGYPHAGRIDFKENRVDTGTGTVRIRGRIPNPAHPPDPALSAAAGGAAGATAGSNRLLYPGLFARVRVPAGGPRTRPVIPEEALMTGQEGRYVYVVGADNKVAKRTVTVGAQVYRAPPPGSPAAAGWTLAGPQSAAAPVKSVVAIDKGLTPDDVVIVDGLQKARPGGEVAPDKWEFQGPAGKK